MRPQAATPSRAHERHGEPRTVEPAKHVSSADSDCVVASPPGVWPCGTAAEKAACLRHNSRANTLFCDGHVVSLNEGELQPHTLGGAARGIWTITVGD